MSAPTPHGRQKFTHNSPTAFTNTTGHPKKKSIVSKDLLDAFKDNNVSLAKIMQQDLLHKKEMSAKNYLLEKEVLKFEQDRATQQAKVEASVAASFELLVAHLGKIVEKSFM